MKPLSYFVLAIGVCLCTASLAAESPGDAILGEWYTEGNESKVEITKRTDTNGKTKYYGALVWFENPVYDADDPEAGVTLHDRKNKDESRRAKPLLGLLMLKNFTYDRGDKEWNDGTIYDPNVGKTYSCTMNIANDPKVPGQKILNVRGYIGIPTFGRTTVWTKVPDKVETE